MTLNIRWIEDGNTRPAQRQLRMLGGYCCAEVARTLGWSWGRAARALLAAGAVQAGSLRGQRVEDHHIAGLRR